VRNTVWEGCEEVLFHQTARSMNIKQGRWLMCMIMFEISKWNWNSKTTAIGFSFGSRKKPHLFKRSWNVYNNNYAHIVIITIIIIYNYYFFLSILYILEHFFTKISIAYVYIWMIITSMHSSEFIKYVRLFIIFLHQLHHLWEAQKYCFCSGIHDD